MDDDLCPVCYRRGMRTNYASIFQSIQRRAGGPITCHDIGGGGSSLKTLERAGYLYHSYETPLNGGKNTPAYYLTMKGIHFMYKAGFDMSIIMQRLESKVMKANEVTDESGG